MHFKSLPILSALLVVIFVGGGSLIAGVVDCTPFFPLVELALFPFLAFGITTGVEGADNRSNPLAIKSKNRDLDVKFRMRRWSAPYKGFVRRGTLEHRTVIYASSMRNALSIVEMRDGAIEITKLLTNRAKWPDIPTEYQYAQYCPSNCRCNACGRSLGRPIDCC